MSDIYLTQVTEALNEALDDAEGVLVGLNIGVSAWVPIESVVELATSKRLIFAKRDNVWGLFVQAADGSGERTPLRSASREVRCAAAHCLRALHRAILAGTSEQAEAVRAATAEVRRFILDAARPEGPA